MYYYDILEEKCAYSLLHYMCLYDTNFYSKFVLNFSIYQWQEQVEEWEKKLSLLSDTLDEWLAGQRTWMYLENIFGAEDIQKQLPAESQKFMIVDRTWKAIMTRTNGDPLVSTDA